MGLELLHFLTTDKLRLPGLLYKPDKKTKVVAIYLHGNGTASVVYSPFMNILGKKLTENGISFFPFNNRGAHLVKSLKKIQNGVEERVVYGTAYELIKECILDIDAAINLLITKGFNKFFLIGESTGANKIVVYQNYKQKNPVSRYVLLSGGDDTGLYYKEYGDKLFKKVLNQCKEMIKKGKGTNLVPKYISSYPMSYQSIYDTINPEGDYNIFPFNNDMNKLNLSKKPLFSEFAKMKKPTLVIYGDKDEYCYGDVKKCVSLLQASVSKKRNFTFKIVPGADHGFTGKEEELAKNIVEWLT